MGASNYVHLDVDEIVRETDKAFLVATGTDFGERDEFWVPKSQMSDPDDYAEGDRDCTISVTEWWARKNDRMQE